MTGGGAAEAPRSDAVGGSIGAAEPGCAHNCAALCTVQCAGTAKLIYS